MSIFFETRFRDCRFSSSYTFLSSIICTKKNFRHWFCWRVRVRIIVQIYWTKARSHKHSRGQKNASQFETFVLHTKNKLILIFSYIYFYVPSMTMGSSYLRISMKSALTFIILPYCEIWYLLYSRCCRNMWVRICFSCNFTFIWGANNNLCKNRTTNLYLNNN